MAFFHRQVQIAGGENEFLKSQVPINAGTELIKELTNCWFLLIY